MIKRVSSSQMMSSITPKTNKNSYTKLSDVLVDLSVRETPKVVRRLKLVGDPYEYTEFNEMQPMPNPNNDPALRYKTVKVPFPDSDTNKMITRIGHLDPDKCPWRKLGYTPITRYAQNCFERQEDGSWKVKVLKGGKTIFKPIALEQLSRMSDEDLDDDDPKHFGTRVSPCVRITATNTGMAPPKSVEYSVSFDPKSTTITDEMIEDLRKCGEPSAEDLAVERNGYIKDAKNDKSMPEWEDFFAYGYPLHVIFKHTPVKSNDFETVTVAKKQVAVVEEDIEPDLPSVKSSNNDDDEDDTPVVSKSSKKPAPKPVVVEEDEDEEDTLGWMQ